MIEENVLSDLGMYLLGQVHLSGLVGLMSHQGIIVKYQTYT